MTRNIKTILTIPRYVEAAYDPLSHKTQDDIWFLVRHELDLFEEGETNDIKTHACANRARRFLEKFKPADLRAAKP